MSQKTHLKISTPQGIFFDADIDIVTLKTTNGYIGLQRNRLPFISNIEISTLYINAKGDKDEKICAIGGGLVYVEREYIDIFTDDICYQEDIDVNVIQKLIVQTEKKLKAKISEAETFKNELLLKKAINKITTLKLE